MTTTTTTKRALRLVTRWAPVIRCTQCGTPYVLRYSYVFAVGCRWLYQRDCKCRKSIGGGNLGVDEVETAPVEVFTRRPGA